VDAYDQVLRNAGWWLVAGGLLAVVGAFWPPYRQWIAPLEEGLRVIAAHPIGWKMIHAGFVTGTWTVVVGLCVLAIALHGRDGGTLALVTAVLFGVAAVCWSLNISFRLSTTVQAAQHLVATGSIPDDYAASSKLNSYLFAGFSVLAYLSVATLGWVVLQSDLASRAVGWLLIVWGLSFGFVIGRNVPVVAYVPAIIVGWSLLRS
jgi:hypothetical protein